LRQCARTRYAATEGDRWCSKENERENVYKQREEMMEKDDQREGMAEASKDMSDQTRGEDKSQMATKDQSDKTKGEMMEEREGGVERLARMFEALVDYSITTRSMVRALWHFTSENGVGPPTPEAFWREVHEASGLSVQELAARLVQRNFPVEITPPWPLDES